MKINKIIAAFLLSISLFTSLNYSNKPNTEYEKAKQKVSKDICKCKADIIKIIQQLCGELNILYNNLNVNITDLLESNNPEDLASISNVLDAKDISLKLTIHGRNMSNYRKYEYIMPKWENPGKDYLVRKKGDTSKILDTVINLKKYNRQNIYNIVRENLDDSYNHSYHPTPIEYKVMIPSVLSFYTG